MQRGDLAGKMAAEVASGDLRAQSQARALAKIQKIPQKFIHGRILFSVRMLTSTVRLRDSNLLRP